LQFAALGGSKVTDINAPEKRARDILSAAAFRAVPPGADEQGILQLPVAVARFGSAAAIRAASREAFWASCPVKNASPKSAGIQAMIRKSRNTNVNSTTACPEEEAKQPKSFGLGHDKSA